MAAVDKFKLLNKIYDGKGDNIGKAYKVIKQKFSDRIESNNINYNYVINYRDPKRRIITLLFEYLDYAHDVYIGDRVPSDLKAHLPWLTKTKPKLKKDGTPGQRQVLDHHANFQDYLSAYGQDPKLIGSLNTMLSTPAEPNTYEYIFKIIYELFTLSGNNFHINQTALDKLATKYKVSIDQIGNQGSERGLKYILLYFITEVRKAGFIKPVYGSLIKEYINPKFRDIYCIFDQSTTCYGLRNLLGRCENVLTYTDKGYSQSSGTILQTLTFEQTGGAVKYKKTRDTNYIISENNLAKKKTIKTLLKTTQEEVEGEEGSVEEEEIPTTFENIVTTKIKNGDIQEVTSAPPIFKKKVNHLLLNGTITFDIKLEGNSEFKCTYNSDKLSFIIERNGKSLTTLLTEFFIKYQLKIADANKNLIQKMISNPEKSSILSAGDCGKLCAVINKINPKSKDINDKNDLLLLLSKSKFMGDYGPILLSSIIPNVPNDLKLPYFIHQTGDSSAQNQALALYYASFGGDIDLIECKINDINSKLQLLLSSDSGLIKTRQNIVVTCNGLALYLSNDFRDLFKKTQEQGSGKKLRSKKNKVNKLKTKNKRKHKKYSKKKQLNKKLSLKRNTQKGGFDEPHDKPELNENITADNIIRIEETDLDIYCDNLIDLYNKAVEKRPVLMNRLGPSEVVQQVLRDAQERRTALGADGYTVTAAEGAMTNPRRAAKQASQRISTMRQGPTGSTNPDESQAMNVTSDQQATKRRATKRGASNTSIDPLQTGAQKGPRKTIARQGPSGSTQRVLKLNPNPNGSDA